LFYSKFNTRMDLSGLQNNIENNETISKVLRNKMTSYIPGSFFYLIICISVGRQISCKAWKLDISRASMLQPIFYRLQLCPLLVRLWFLVCEAHHMVIRSIVCVLLTKLISCKQHYTNVFLLSSRSCYMCWNSYLVAPFFCYLFCVPA
jgi:hypothetical protein